MCFLPISCSTSEKQKIFYSLRLASQLQNVDEQQCKASNDLNVNISRFCCCCRCARVSACPSSKTITSFDIGSDKHRCKQHPCNVISNAKFVCSGVYFSTHQCIVAARSRSRDQNKMTCVCASCTQPLSANKQFKMNAHFSASLIIIEMFVTGQVSELCVCCCFFFLKIIIIIWERVHACTMPPRWSEVCIILTVRCALGVITSTQQQQNIL